MREQARDIEGWMSRPELDWLADMASQHHVIIEIGSWKGRSTVTLAQATPGTVFLVDHFQGACDGSEGYSELSTIGGREKVRDDLLFNMAPWIGKGRAFLVELPSDQAIIPLKYILKHRAADMVFIDGDHSYEGVKANISDYWPILRPGGLLCGHDADWPEVRRAIDELAPGWGIGADTIWFKEKASPLAVPLRP